MGTLIFFLVDMGSAIETTITTPFTTTAEYTGGISCQEKALQTVNDALLINKPESSVRITAFNPNATDFIAALQSENYENPDYKQVIVYDFNDQEINPQSGVPLDRVNNESTAINLIMKLTDEDGNPYIERNLYIVVKEEDVEQHVVVVPRDDNDGFCLEGLGTGSENFRDCEITFVCPKN